jgi:hypothetical protein
MMVKRVLVALLCLSLGSWNGFNSLGNTTQLGGLGHGATLFAGTCQHDSAGTDGQTYTMPTGASDGDAVLVVVVVLSEDAAATFGVDGVTLDGAAMTQVVDEDGTGIVNSAIFQSAGIMQGAAEVTIILDHSEAVTSASVCGFALRGLSSTTATSSVADDDTGSGALVLTTGTTTAGGFVVGGCVSQDTAVTTTWAVLTEIEDTTNTEADVSNASAAATGASMANTCDWSGTGDASGVAAAYR